MLHSTFKASLRVVGITFCLIIFFLCYIKTIFAASVPIAAAPVISRGVPAYTSDDCFGSSAASRANDNDYSTLWRSCTAEPSSGTPVTLSYDLSGVSSTSRQNVILAWYADNTTGSYNHTISSSNAYNLAKDYTIQGNAAAGGSLPGSGWVTLATITGNVYHSRQHSINLTGYNWVRISVTASEGSAANMDVTMNMDIQNVSAGIVDDWIFYGDSITMDGMQHTNNIGDTYSKQINGFNSNYFPIYESGGISSIDSATALSNMDTWLALFPGKFVSLNYGTNDATSLVSGTTFYNNMRDMVLKVLALNKIPIVPKIPWGCTANLTTQVPVLNAKIDELYAAYPAIIQGPDFYTYFNANQSLISGDCIHPSSPDGYTAYRTQWVNKMETAAYTVPILTIAPSTGSFSTTQSVTLSSDKSGTIYYTTNGSTPTTSSSVYSSALSISSTTTVKTITLDRAGNQSDLASATYTFAGSSSYTPPVVRGQSSSTQPQVCNSTAPSFIPDLFQIDTDGKSAKISFTTSKNSINGYQISYGLKENADMYGDNFGYSGPEWVLSRSIANLQPNTTYYFKVRASNSCNAGQWSKVKKATTKSKSVTTLTSNVLGIQAKTGSCSYTVEQGNTLWTIAREQLGSGAKYKSIINLNPDLQTNGKSVLKVGSKLKTC